MGHGMNRLQEFRQEHRLALWGLAARTGVSASTLSAIERWDYLPSVPVRRRIAHALGVNVMAIWPGAETDQEVQGEPQEPPP